jgi:hypothetical protein
MRPSQSDSLSSNQFDTDLARVEQIRRAHQSAKPTTENLSWMNCHHDCGFLLGFIDKLCGEYSTVLNKLIDKLEGATSEPKAQRNRFSVYSIPRDNGRGVTDEDHPADVLLRIDGNFEDDEQRKEYAKEIVALLNAATVPPSAELTQVGEMIDVDDGQGTCIVDISNEMRDQMPGGTKLYARLTETKSPALTCGRHVGPGELCKLELQPYAGCPLHDRPAEGSAAGESVE